MTATRLETSMKEPHGCQRTPHEQVVHHLPTEKPSNYNKVPINVIDQP